MSKKKKIVEIEESHKTERRRMPIYTTLDPYIFQDVKEAAALSRRPMAQMLEELIRFAMTVVKSNRFSFLTHSGEWTNELNKLIQGD